jgi:Borrelia membrane protein P13
MIKVLLLTIMFILAVGTVQSEETTKNRSFQEIQTLIDEDLTDNLEEISKKASLLSFEEKTLIYTDYSKDNWGPAALNLIGFWIGSFTQGDVTGGAIGLIGCSAGLVLFLDGVMEENTTGESSLIPLGAVIYLSSVTIDVILSFTYASSYNSKLETALGLDGIAQIYISPTVNLAKNNSVAPGIAVSLSF